uniref:TFIIE domain-containing protein n=1 Tax=Steinernema glaseri TaxID=37863 RepID=A0A1I7ZFA3_9BILA
MDSRVLRQLLVQLKVDKIVKERVVSVENPTPPNGRPGKPRKVSYYFVNYKAVLNVARYKIDHMRQKLESREKNDVNKANYKCTKEGCGATYQSLEIDQLIDMMTGDMRCWRCQGLVENDQAAGPTDLTRTSLAKFNDQMAALFSMLQSLDGIRLAQHLLEPPIQIITTTPQEEPDESKKKFLQVGAKAFGGHHASRKDMFNQEVTVNIINGSVPLPVVEEKESVPWLSANSNFDVSADANQKPSLGFASSSAPVLSYAQQEQQVPRNHFHIAESTSRLPEVRALLNREKELIKEHEEERKKWEGAGRRPSRVTFTLDEEDMDYEDEEDFIQLTVQGEPIEFEEITENPEIVNRMTEAERNVYIRVWREHMEFC